jgi:hypothetical protein
MFRDPIIEELRKIRHTIEESCDNDPEKYYVHLLEIQKQYCDRLVRREPKPALILRDKRRAA